MRRSSPIFFLLALCLVLALTLRWEMTVLGNPLADFLGESSRGELTGGWRSAGPYDDALQPLRVADVAASPAYANDGVLFAATEAGVYRSTNRGNSWQRVLQGTAEPSTRFTHVRLSPNYAEDGTLFVSFVEGETAGLYKSTDRGQNWTRDATVGTVHAIALSPAYAADRTLFIGRASSVWKSTDGGAAWVEYSLVPEGESFDIFDLAISPNYAADQTLFASGYGPVRRSLDGGVTWQSMGGYAPAYEIVLSPNYAADGRAWGTFRAIESAGDGTPESAVFRTTNRGVSWSLPWAGLPGTYEPFTRHLAISPTYGSDQTLFTALSGQFVGGDKHSLFRTVNSGDSWIDLGPAPDNPDVFGLAATSTPGEGLVAHVATEKGVWHYAVGSCEERLADGGFEIGTAWTLPVTAYPAGYSTATVRSGMQSLRAGIVEGADRFSYSSAAQTVTLPPGVTTATLELWWYPLSEEGALQQRAAEAISAASIAELESPTAPAAGDRQYVLVLDSQGTILEQLLWTRSNAASWQKLSFDLSAYAGQTIRIHMGVFNNGDGQRTAMFVDDVSLVVCTSAPQWRIYLPLILKESVETPIPTPTVTPTPTPTPVTLQPRWLRSLVVEPGENGRLLGITNEGRLISSPDQGASWSYLPLPDAIAGSPLQYRSHLALDYLQPGTLYLGARQQGLWRSTDGGATWSQRSTIPAGPVAVSPLDSAHLWAGVPWREEYQSYVMHSSDAGITWQAAGTGLSGEVASPIVIDPQEGNRRYLITQGDRGGATLYRSSNGNWEAIANAPVGTPPSGGPGLGLALNAGSRGLYVASNAGALSVSHNAHSAPADEISWSTVYSFTGGYLPIPLAVGSSDGHGPIYLTLYDWFSGEGRTLRSDDGGANWISLSLPPYGVPPGVACYEGIVNGSFEDNSGWVIRANPAPAAYVNQPVHSGGRSMRTGIAAGSANVKSYSPFDQTVTIPALPFPGASAVQLRFWRYNVYGDPTVREQMEPLPALADLPRTEAELAAWSATTDLFYVIVIHPNGAIDWLLTERVHAPTWREATIDLKQYAGKTFRLQFGTFNNGTGGISRTFVDDVTLQICPPESALLLPRGWASRVIGRPESATLYADANGILYRSNNAGASWVASGTARPEHTILSGNPNQLYAGDGYPCYAGGPDVSMWRSTDRGTTWQVVPAGKNLKPLAHHESEEWLYAAGCDGPYLSKNGGGSFTHQPSSLFGIYDVHFVQPVGDSWTEVWIGGISEGGGGAVLMSRDGGATWERSSPMQLELGWLGDLALDRFQSGRVYAPAFYGFFYTPDNGATWVENSQGLEAVTGDVQYGGLFAVAQSPTGEHRLYLGTMRGLYTRDPSTGVWSKITGQPFDQLQVRDLLILDAAPQRLYVTTPQGVFVYSE
jgi:photosystem II stability/assembly factor-like uncharacterized protein